MCSSDLSGCVLIIDTALIGASIPSEVNGSVNISVQQCTVTNQTGTDFVAGVNGVVLHVTTSERRYFALDGMGGSKIISTGIPQEELDTLPMVSELESLQFDGDSTPFYSGGRQKMMQGSSFFGDFTHGLEKGLGYVSKVAKPVAGFVKNNPELLSGLGMSGSLSTGGLSTGGTKMRGGRFKKL